MSPRRLEDQDDSCCTTCSFQSSNPPQQQQFLRIATWEAAARTLASYVEMYHMLHPEAPRILIHSVPSIEELQNSINLMTASPVETRLDGFVVPPVLLGSLADELVTIEPNDSTQYLPLYEQLTTVDGRRAALPLFSGNQLLLFYRRDLLDVLNLPPPSSWKEVAYIAKNLHGAKVDDATTLSGLCLGLMSEQACRQQASATGMPCHSQSMTYWGTILASMTQSQGSESGWLWDADIRNGLKPLLNATLERTLELLEEQLLYSSTDELQTDASLSLERFQQGVCAMTISADHPIDLLLDDNVGFVALPGSTQVLDRRSKTLKPCTFRSCPYRYGRANLNQSGEGVNQAPLGALDLAMGGIAASSYNQVAMREFLEFVETHRLNISVSAAPQQPLTYADLEHTSGTNPGLQAYTKLMEALTSDPNAALPLQIPTAFSLMSELDHQVYEYLLAENYNQANRKQVVRRIEQSWDIRIQQQDSRIHATPLSVLYKRSLQGPIGEELQDLYIGNTFRIIGWAMGGIACLLAVGFAIWVYVHQHERVIRASQPLFLWMVCAGAFIMASSIFPFGIEDDIVTTEGATVACMSSMWLYGVGFVMLVSALYSKIWRINRIFRHAHKIRKIKIERKHLMVPFLSLLGINIVLLLVWTITDPSQWIREEFEEGTRNGSCYSDDYRIYIALLVCVNLLVAFYTLIQAFECRKLSTEYEESVWIGASLVCIVQVWLISMPILQLTGNTPSWLFMTKVTIVFFTCISTLLFIFIPKIGYLRKETMDGGSASGDSTRIFEEGEEETEAEEAGQFQSVFPLIRFGSQSMIADPADKGSPAYKKLKSSGVLGIRIVRASGEHSQDLERLQHSLTQAEARRTNLQDQLENLQEKFEQYVVANHPHGAHVGAHMDITEASRKSVRSLLNNSSFQHRQLEK